MSIVDIAGGSEANNIGVAENNTNFKSSSTTVKSGRLQGCFISDNVFDLSNPNGHIFVDSPLIRHRTSTWKIRRDFIDFERRIHVELITLIRRGNFNVDSPFKIDEISMTFPRGFFYVD